jgi:hypothetical protein
MIDQTATTAIVPFFNEVAMPRNDDVRRKLVEFDAETWQAVDLLARDQLKSFQELASEAFRDLLRKYNRPSDLKAALRQSARASETAGSQGAKIPRRKRPSPHPSPR